MAGDGEEGRPPASPLEKGARGDSAKPSLYLLHGDDLLAISDFLGQMRARLGDPSIADLNFTRLDGRQASEEEIRTAAATLPFISERRLVVIYNPLARLGNETARKRFLALIESLPPETAFVLVIEDQVEPRRRDWEVLRADHWLMKWVSQSGRAVFVRAFALPRMADMPNWIRKQAQTLGGEIGPAAALALANQIGNDTLLACQELNKLLLYVNFTRPIETADVELLTAPGGQASVFDMVDALALGNSETAIRLLHLLLEEQEAQALFAMIVRQFRLLLQTREILDEGSSPTQVAVELNQPQFVADKLVRQAQRFRMSTLEAIYHHLLELDEGMKTSRIEPEVALDLFVAELAG